MRNIYVAVAALMLALMLAGCASDEKRYVVGVSQCSQDEWREKMNHEMQREAMLSGDVELRLYTAGDDSRRQVRDINRLVAQGVDLLVVSPNEDEAVRPAIERAYDKGIPVVIFDRRISSDKYTAFISADNTSIGRMAGIYIASQARGRQVSVLEIRGLRNSAADSERHAGFAQAIAEHPNVRVMASLYGDWLERRTAEQVGAMLKKQDMRQVDYVFALNDRMALAAYRTVKKSQPRFQGRFVGIDGLSSSEAERKSGHSYGVDLVSEGVLDATFLYPTSGDKVIRLAMKILRGEPYQKENVLPTALINKDNASLMLLQNRQIESLDSNISTLNDKLYEFLGRYAAQRLLLMMTVALAVVLAVLLGIVIHTYWLKRRLNERLEDDKRQLQENLEQLQLLQHRLEDATTAKLRFFTNVSHDFRTPLTLITDPVEQIVNDKTTPPAIISLLRIVHKNAAILSRMVNQILDFRSYEGGHLEAKMRTIGLEASMREWCEGFVPTSTRRGIRFTLHVEPEHDYNVMLDGEKTERIVFNLISNAFKYTPDGGEITVSLALAANAAGDKQISIRVSDNGIGIEEDHLGQIFDRYYQIDRSHPGAGLGLALVKAFVDVQGGTITVESRQGEGSTFAVLLPYRSAGSDAEAETVCNISQDRVQLEVDRLDIDTATTGTAEADDDTKPRLLIIDDNADIRAYMRYMLHRDYNISEAENGADGLDKARALVPDIIVCDVMMPVMDGMECCRRIKREVETSHIPVVILTACSLDEQRAKDYNCGADSYLSKPFSKAVLIARLSNLLESRRRLLELFGDRSLITKAKVSEVDKTFAARLRDCIEQRLSDPDLSVDNLAAMVNLSRVQLYRKVKALTDSTPTDLLRNARLQKAAALLRDTDKTVSEIAYDTGFSSPSYFTKCYREKYGETPSECVTRLRKH